jgi:hypothetical protein
MSRSARSVVFAAISALFQSISASVAAANRLCKAHADGAGRPDYYMPYDGSNPQQVAMYLAGLYAADTSANILATMAPCATPEASYVDALRSIADGALDDDQKVIISNVANATWRAGQPFRDIADKPLQGITRDINIQFNELPANERNKDLVQVAEGAKILLEAIEAARTQADRAA